MEDRVMAYAREAFLLTGEEERRGAIGSLRRLIFKHVSANTRRTTWRGCRETPYPFYDYWEAQAGWDATARAALSLAGLGRGGERGAALVSIPG